MRSKRSAVKETARWRNGQQWAEVALERKYSWSGDACILKPNVIGGTRSDLKARIVKSNNASETEIKVYVLEQNLLLSKALVQLLRKRSNFIVLGDCSDGTGLLEKLMDNPCDVLLLSSLEPLRTIGKKVEACESLKKIKVVLYGMEDSPKHFLQAVQLRATGYLLKDASSMDIIAAIRGVVEGNAICPPRLCKSLLDHYSNTFTEDWEKVKPSDTAASDLTCRQRQLMALVAEGKTNKEIATDLHLSEFTVKNHIHRVMRSLEVDSRYAAVDVIRMRGLFHDTNGMLR